MSEQPKQQPAYHLWSLPELESNLETSLSEGLKDSQIKELQEKYGPNELTAGGGISVLSILAGQVSTTLWQCQSDPKLTPMYRSGVQCHDAGKLCLSRYFTFVLTVHGFVGPDPRLLRISRDSVVDRKRCHRWYA